MTQKAIRFYGTEGDDIINGTMFNDIFKQTSGDDTYIGGYGNDTYLLSPKLGNVVIEDNGSSKSDVIVLDEGYRAVDFRYYTDLIGNDLIMEHKTSGNTITIIDHFVLDENGIRANALEKLQFANGSSMSLLSIPKIIDNEVNLDDWYNMHRCGADDFDLPWFF